MKINRRELIKLSLIAIGASSLTRCKTQKKIDVKFAGANSNVGHLLRQKQFPKPQTEIKVETLIIGAGVAGLSTASYLKKHKYNDFLVLELDSQIGGNAKSGKNVITAYPFGAHYLPIPNLSYQELLDFLLEHNVIIGYDEYKIPIYNEYYLCFEPNERLYYRGSWQEGLIPKNGVPQKEIDEIKRFFSLMEFYKNKIGIDGKPAFTIPTQYCSKDESLLKLDSISMNDFLVQNKFSSDVLRWYVNYSCKDDFGSDLNQTSAWAGIHYFASRKGKASNADSHHVLTWPEGNNFLVQALSKNIRKEVFPNQLVFKIEKKEGNYECCAYDVIEDRTIKYISKNCVLATPQFVNKKLVNNLNLGINWEQFEYFPWLVANITIANSSELNEKIALCWDNVIYNSNSLGYVNACHQNLKYINNKTVITYYYAFSGENAKHERLNIFKKNEEFWKDFIINDLKKAHATIDENIESVELYVYGHGMICPSKGLQLSIDRKKLAQGFENLYFTNSDVNGISIFEEAFFNGTEAAKKILNT